MTRVEEGASNEWLEPVADEDYDRLPATCAPQPTAEAEQMLRRMGGAYHAEFNRTDPELMERFHNFAFGEVVEQTADRLDDRTRFICYLATLIGCQGIDEYRALLPAALNVGVEPVDVREIVYQATAYLGMGRISPFLTATNEVFAQRGIALPLAPQARTTMETRMGMFNPLYFLSEAYEGAGTSVVAKHWRVNAGLFQTDTSLCTEANLALALAAHEEVADVKFTPVWGQGHVMAEVSGGAEENLVAWILECCKENHSK